MFRPIPLMKTSSKAFHSLLKALFVNTLLISLVASDIALPVQAQQQARSLRGQSVTEPSGSGSPLAKEILRASRTGADATASLRDTTHLYQAPAMNGQGPQGTGSTTILVDSTCYPDAPDALKIQALAAAQAIVRASHDPSESVRRNAPSEISSGFFSLLFFAIAHAVSRDADLTLLHDDLVDRLEVKRLQAQLKRTDKQIGASARAEGSTSAAERPGFVDLLGFAIEHGAIQKEVNGTTLTLSSSPYALIAAGQGDTATTYQNYGYLSRIGVSASFNISNQDNVLANATRNQLTEWNARARLTPDRTMRSQSAEEIWESIRQGFAQPVLVISRETATQFQSDVQLEATRRDIVGRFLSPVFTTPVSAVLQDTALDDQQKMQEIARLILCQVKTDIFDAVRSGALRIDQNTRERIINVTIPAYAAALRAKEAAVKSFEDQLEALSYKSVVTLAYTNKRETMGSDYSVLKLLFEKKAHEGFSLIANAGVSLYHNPDRQMNQQRIRDFAAALSFEGRAGRSPFLTEELDESQIIFSFTGRYQRMLENRGVQDKKADIAVAQFKLEIPFFSGITIPLSVTYANATELIKEDHVRANFGFSVDADKIFKVLKLKSVK